MLSNGVSCGMGNRVLRLRTKRNIVIGTERVRCNFSVTRGRYRFCYVLLRPVLLYTSRRLSRSFISSVLSSDSLPCILLSDRAR